MIDCILLIDDDLNDNEFHSLAIEESAACRQIREVNNGAEALNYLIRSADPANAGAFPLPDLIFLDLNMPLMNGFTFLEEYSKLEPGMKAKKLIVMLSVPLNRSDEIKAKSIREIDDFCFKPLTSVMVRDIIDRYFDC